MGDEEGERRGQGKEGESVGLTRNLVLGEAGTMTMREIDLFENRLQLKTLQEGLKHKVASVDITPNLVHGADLCARRALEGRAEACKQAGGTSPVGFWEGGLLTVPHVGEGGDLHFVNTQMPSMEASKTIQPSLPT